MGGLTLLAATGRAGNWSVACNVILRQAVHAADLESEPGLLPARQCGVSCFSILPSPPPPGDWLREFAFRRRARRQHVGSKAKVLIFGVAAQCGSRVGAVLVGCATTGSDRTDG